MALPKLEGIVTISSGSSVSVTETGGGGTASVSLTAGDYSLSELCAYLADALTANATLSGTYSCSVADDSDTSSGKVTISASGITSFTLTWTSTTVRDALGFVGTLEPTAATFTADDASPWIWLPNVGRSDADLADGDEGDPIRQVAVNCAPSGDVYSWASSALRYETVIEFQHVKGYKGIRSLEVVTNESLQTFFETVISKGIPFRYYTDRSNDDTYTEHVAKQGDAERFGLEPEFKGWRGAQSIWSWRCDTYTTGASLTWTPLDVSPYLWLKADDGVTLTSSAVSTWADQSGNGRDFTQSTAGYRPTNPSSVQNGLPGVLFDGTDDYLSRAAFLSGTTNAEWFFVCQSTRTAASTNGWHDLGSNATSCLYPYLDDAIYDGIGATTRSNLGSGTSFVRTAHIYNVSSANPHVARVDGSQIYSGAATVGWAATFKLGESSVISTCFRGYLFEVVCTPPLTTDERASMLNYLETRWGL